MYYFYVFIKIFYYEQFKEIFISILFIYGFKISILVFFSIFITIYKGS